MPISACKTRHRTVEAGGVELFIREAGDPNHPVVLLLHGFPSSSHSFRHLIPLLADTAHLVAPDMPGFGFSEAPLQDRYEYSFENITYTIEALTDVLRLERMFLYVHDFGAPLPINSRCAGPSEYSVSSFRTEMRMTRVWALPGTQRKPFGRIHLLRTAQHFLTGSTSRAREISMSAAFRSGSTHCSRPNAGTSIGSA